ncbi:GNAT family N-acetyltransferase [Allobranchiibius sp. CTAmp26]|uniref:GNAT family N-acetyltransferase n=1 Tax=Allobranchiibius sp. CTAmp26 TaxID=2815214 RepID=UPI001AA151BA|nr:GNAT family N-acetyltransferase [Allobranchiibius sp. CTAmp26]MBO1754638.1 GNAT family N-acetyltransferase [Allobranchiibius sp. CTAmp26]
MQTLESDRLLIRPWSAEDVDFVLDMYSRWDVQRFIGRTPKVMSNRSEAEAAVARWNTGDHPTYGIWAIEHRESGDLLGTLMLKPIPASSDEDPLPPSGDIEIGWHLHPDAWGHGYAAEGGTRILQHAFDSGLARVVAVTLEANTASQAVARRIGMTHEGPTNRYYNMTCELFTATHPGSGGDRIAASL